MKAEWICWRCYAQLTGRKLSSQYDGNRVIECYWCGGRTRRAIRYQLAPSKEEEGSA